MTSLTSTVVFLSTVHQWEILALSTCTLGNHKICIFLKRKEWLEIRLENSKRLAKVWVIHTDTQGGANFPCPELLNN
jgi:hypothetical protein